MQRKPSFGHLDGMFQVAKLQILACYANNAQQVPKRSVHTHLGQVEIWRLCASGGVQRELIGHLLAPVRTMASAAKDLR
jgi:hypothetical protein